MIEDSRFGPYVKKTGNKYYPIGRSVIHSENLWREKNWEARRDSDGRCYFEQMNGAHGGGVIIYELTEQEFERIKQGELSYDGLVTLTDHDPDRNPVKIT
ncbi:hypothetical protein LH51_03650 [Nitrincola sp. A-D6]|uniref:hypothetical protein n=1 Tax=Nitrincola sp. A-D6 TaxID=1545442 RepID=UPI00051FD4B8|nr:hypothetical protein [Nitrincola sp. A-D6]KGK42906.1 hypothetical protein LH51_03650 [Nitrincola sp. A-D6]